MMTSGMIRAAKIAIPLFAFLFSLNTSSARSKELRVHVSNPSSFARYNETISLSWKSLTTKFPLLKKENTVVVDANSGNELLSQLIDGEFLFQSGFEPNETKSFIVKNAESKADKQSLVDGRFVEPRQDYAWENDRIAFRMYGPALAKEVNNGIDVWTKRVRHLIVQKWYKGEEDTGAAKISYHVDHGEGADFFSVGKTLGAGSCGIWHNEKVYQPGVFSSYRTIANGPIRLVFELTYDSLIVEGKRFKEVKRITLDAGQNLNKVEVIYFGEMPDEEIQSVVGLVKRKGVAFAKDDKECWMSLWGLTNADTVNGSLGTGVVIVSSTFVHFREDKEQYLAVVKARVGRPFTYFTGAGWTRSGDFSTEQDWKNYLSSFAQSQRAPMKIRVAK
jgi:pectinesterase